MSKIKALNFANYVEDCKKALRDKHLEHNLIVSKDLSLIDLVNQLSNYPQPELTNYTPQLDLPELPDLFELADSEPLITENTQAYISVLGDTHLQQDFYIPSGCILKTSDGAMYQNTGTSSKKVSHVWDLSKDIDTSRNFKLRWLMCIGNASRVGTSSYTLEIANYTKNGTITSLQQTYPYVVFRYFDKCTLNIPNSIPRISLRAVMCRNCIKSFKCTVPGLRAINSESLFTESVQDLSLKLMKYVVENTDANFITQGYLNIGNLVINSDSMNSYVRCNGVFTDIYSTYINCGSEDGLIKTVVSSQSSTNWIPCIEVCFHEAVATNNFKIDLTDDCQYLISAAFEKEINLPLRVTYGETYRSRTSIIKIFEKLKDLTGEESKTVTLGSYMLAQLTEEEKLIAINKNWTLA